MLTMYNANDDAIKGDPLYSKTQFLFRITEMHLTNNKMKCENVINATQG